MKKTFLPILLSLLLILPLAACGGSSGGGDSGSSSADKPAGPVGNMTNEGGSDMAAGWDDSYDAEAPESAVSDNALPANTKVIYSADMTLETKEFDSAEQAINRIVASLGGWFENRSVYQGGGSRSLRCTVRVPAKSFTAFLDQAGQAAHVTSRDEYAEDVSEAYYDSESRLVTQKTKLERLHHLLSQAEAMEDIISLENAISETELEIERLTGSLRKYDSLVGYSTVTLRLEEVYKLSTDEEVAVTFGQRLGSAFSLGLQRGINGLEDFCIALARNWFNLIILAVLVAVVILLLRWRRKRCSHPKPPKGPEPPQPPQPPESNG